MVWRRIQEADLVSVLLRLVFSFQKTRELFGYLRFLHATDAELLSIGAHEGMKLEEVEPITPRLEIEVLQHLKRACEEALAKFDTTLEEDDALLRSNQLTDSNVRNCVIMRRGEKQVLRFWTNLADTAIPLLRLNWIELRKHASKFLTSSSRDHFVTHVVAQLVKKTSGM
jgi:hypothetical protein